MQATILESVRKDDSISFNCRVRAVFHQTSAIEVVLHFWQKQVSCPRLLGLPFQSHALSSSSLSMNLLSQISDAFNYEVRRHGYLFAFGLCSTGAKGPHLPVSTGRCSGYSV